VGPMEAGHYHWHKGRKIDDKVKNKIYFKRTQLLRGPRDGRVSVLESARGWIVGGLGVCEDLEGRCIE